MARFSSSSRALEAARTKRGWSIRDATQRMVGITDQQLMNLEHAPGASRHTDPRHVRLATAVELVRTYWPDLQVDDLMGERTDLRLTATDTRARRRLERYAAATYAKGAA